MSRAITQEELTQSFLDSVRMLVDHWDRTPLTESQSKRLQGLAFSILVLLDGCCSGMPAFDIVARPHPDDKAFCIALRGDYIEDGTKLLPWLHEQFYKK